MEETWFSPVTTRWDSKTHQGRTTLFQQLIFFLLYSTSSISHFSISLGDPAIKMTMKWERNLLSSKITKVNTVYQRCPKTFTISHYKRLITPISSRSNISKTFCRSWISSAKKYKAWGLQTPLTTHCFLSNSKNANKLKYR